LVIPFGDLTREVLEIREEIDQAVARVLDRGWFIFGPEVESFEGAFADWLGVDHVVGVASGTEAITLALMAVGVKEGDEVITVANTCVPTAAGIASSGATVRLADCDPESLMISLQSVEAAVTSKTKAIVPVHLYGSGADMAGLQRIAERHGLYIVEDCAQASGTRIDDQRAGTFGQVNAFSFYPTKNLGAYGDGGCVATNDARLAERLRSVRNYGYQQKDYSTELGLNSRLDAMQAAILSTKLTHLDSWNSRRTEIAQRYTKGLDGSGVDLPRTSDAVENAYHLFPILVGNRDEFQSKLKEAGVQSIVHYPVPLHLQPALAGLGYEPGEFPNAEWACSHVLSLPIFPQLRDDEVQQVIDAVNVAAKAPALGEGEAKAGTR